MIHDIQGNGEAGGSVRVLAVVAGRRERAREVAAQFAALGENIETLWYADSRELLGQAARPRFEAVILFPTRDEAVTDADEASLRDGLTDTPLFRVA
jgi:hypothetical protein